MNTRFHFFLQESKAPLIKIFERSRHLSDGRFQRLLDITFCRIWESLIQNGHFRHDGFQAIEPFLEARYAIERYYRHDAIEKFLSKIRDSDMHAFAPLGDLRMYHDTSCWEALIAKTDQLILESNKMLKLYCRWWIDDREDETSNPTSQTMNDEASFYQLFPVIWFSLMVLLKHQSDSDMVKRIALETTHHLHDFDGYDLCLQRRAFLACIRHHGVAFVLEHDEDLRRELIYYALLKRAFRESDMAQLEEHLNANLSHDAFVNISSGDVLNLIAKKGAYLQRTDLTR